MDKFQLGGFGCALGFAASLLGVAGVLGAGAAAGGLSYLLAIAGAGMVMAATLELKQKFGFRLFLLGGALVLGGTVATLLATLGTLGAIRAAVAARDVAALSSALVGVLVATFMSILGWMFIGAALIMKRREVADALGTQPAVLVLATGVLLVLSPLLGLIGLVPLAFIFFRLGRGAPPAPAPSAT